jgi:hypothetical protein
MSQHDTGSLARIEMGGRMATCPPQDAIQLSKTSFETHRNRLASWGSKLDNMPKLNGTNKKEGGHFWWPPSFEIGILPQDGSGHLARIAIHAPSVTLKFVLELEYLCHAAKS